MNAAPWAVGHDALVDRCAFPPAGTSLRCGWSGGPDSTALVVLAQAAGCVVEALHVDHGLRPGNDDRQRLAAMADHLGLDLRVVEVTVEPGPNLEERARSARRRALGPAAATGHTADDQAESVLLALLRGAGPWGLSAMRPGPTHPLLGLRRSETQGLCLELGLDCVEDPTNASPMHMRNRVRSEVLPLLGDVGRRDPVPQLVRLADHQRELADLLDSQAGAVDVTDGRRLCELPRSVAVAALRRWWRAETQLEHPPDHRALERMLAVARPDGPPRADVADGWRMARTEGRLRLERSVPETH
ncbi:MAG: tRNA lysidine(34) synthetase TilS [Microthrixaceae bacterium]